jgi:hypothetical protein
MIQYFPIVTGSLTVNGDLIVTGTGSMSASLALNSNLLQGTGSTGFATTASLLAVSSSQQQISASLLTLTASYTALSSSYTALSGSYNTFSGSESTRITKIENNYATTGSNSFRADQSITGSLVVSSTITAQTLVVQTVTSSIVYSSGSNLFGSALTDRQTFTGSVNITGSLTVNTTGTEFQVTNAGVKIGNVISDAHSITGSVNVSGSIAAFAGSVGIGIASPAEKIHVFGSSGATSPRILIQSHDIANATAGLTLYGRDASNVNKVSEIITSGSDLTISVNSSERMRITSGGNVGIGNTGSGTDRLSVSDGSTYTFNIGAASGGAGAVLATFGSAALTFATNGTSNERMRITSGGNIGIGVTNPTAKLEVNGTIYSAIRSSTIDTDDGVSNNFQGYGGYWALRTDLSNNFNLDVYGGGTPKNALNILQTTGAATFSNTVSLSDVLRINASSTTSVSTSATTISTGSNTYGGLAIVWGNDASGNIWTDLLFYSLGQVYVIRSQDVSGGPFGRTYTVNGSGSLRLTMGGGTYTVRYQALLTS